MLKYTGDQQPWEKFLVGLNLFRHCGEGSQGIKLAAAAISESDQLEWWRSIRSEAEEILEDGERILINRQLSVLGARTLGG